MRGLSDRNVLGTRWRDGGGFVCGLSRRNVLGRRWVFGVCRVPERHVLEFHNGNHLINLPLVSAGLLVSARELVNRALRDVRRGQIQI